jgi:hypothetical protein
VLTVETFHAFGRDLQPVQYIVIVSSALLMLPVIGFFCREVSLLRAARQRRPSHKYGTESATTTATTSASSAAATKRPPAAPSFMTTSNADDTATTSTAATAARPAPIVPAAAANLAPSAAIGPASSSPGARRRSAGDAFSSQLSRAGDGVSRLSHIVAMAVRPTLETSPLSSAPASGAPDTSRKLQGRIRPFSRTSRPSRPSRPSRRGSRSRGESVSSRGRESRDGTLSALLVPEGGASGATAVGRTTSLPLSRSSAGLSRSRANSAATSAVRRILLPDVAQMYLPPLSRKILEKLVISNPLRVQRLRKEVHRRRSLIADRASCRASCRASYRPPCASEGARGTSEGERGSASAAGRPSEGGVESEASEAADAAHVNESRQLADAAATARLMRQVTRTSSCNAMI